MQNNFFSTFAPLTLADKAFISAMFAKYPHCLEYYAFAGLISWRKYAHAWSLWEKELLLLTRTIHGMKYMLQPIGTLSDVAAESLLSAFDQLEYAMKIVGVSAQFLLKHPRFCSHFDVLNDRSMGNYLYQTAALAHLRGRRFEKKRNLIAQAQEQYQWQVSPLTQGLKADCVRLMTEILVQDDIKAEMLKDEFVALNYALEHFEQLGLKGCAISIDGQLAAFSIYEPLNKDTMVVHFEKARREYKGLYQIVNQESSLEIEKEGFSYINREEDLGIPGLRKAKTSYFPIAILSSYTLTYSKRH